MDEDEFARLQKRFADLSGRVNIAKQQQQPSVNTPYPHPQQYPGPRRLSAPHHGQQRWAPYGHAPYAGQPYRNRQLVVGTDHPPSDMAASPTSPTPPTNMVKLRNNQLINSDTLKREQDQKKGFHNPKRGQKEHMQPNLEPKTRKVTSLLDRIMVIGGINFRVTDKGRKLTRDLGRPSSQRNDEPHGGQLNFADHLNATKETPKTATVAGVTFHRSKHGNLIRATTAAANPRYLPPRPLAYNIPDLLASLRSTIKKPQCTHFMKDGFCPFGPQCKFAHDPEKVVICKTFVRTGSCPSGDACDLSHEMSYNRVPACIHFLRGNCTNDPCRFPHVSVSPTAHVCRAFATFGYCAKGSKCDTRHVIECPDYANSGRCADQASGKCTLPHVARAGVLRKAAKRQAKTGLGEDSDLSSDDDENMQEDEQEEDSDGLESDDQDMFQVLLERTDRQHQSDQSHAFAQQSDFVGFR